MELNKILNTENINIEQLQKGLKHIRLNLSRFDCVVEEQVPGLLELFKIAVDIDPKITTKFIKMDLRSKLEKVLKGHQINNHSNIVDNIEVTKIKALESYKLNNDQQNSNNNRKPKFTSINKKLGKVKFLIPQKDLDICIVSMTKKIASSIYLSY